MPLEVAVQTTAWRLVVAHSADHCTSDDWAWFTNDVASAAAARGLAYAYADAGHGPVVVLLDGAEVARFPLEGQGYLVAAPGRSAEHVGHDTPESVVAAIDRYFEIEGAP